MLTVTQSFISNCYDLSWQSLVCCPTLRMSCVWTLSALGRSCTCMSQNRQKTIQRSTFCWRYVVECRCILTCLLYNCLVLKQTWVNLWTLLLNFWTALERCFCLLFSYFCYTVWTFEPLLLFFLSKDLLYLGYYRPIVVDLTVLTVIVLVTSF